MATGVPSILERPVKRVLDTSPKLQGAADAVYRKYLDAYFAYLERRFCVEEYRAPVDRSRLLWVDPARIRRANNPGFFVRRENICPVIGGDWDTELPAFESIFPYHSFESHYLDGVPWEDTDMFEFAMDLVRSGHLWGGCESRAEVEARFAELDRLYEDIRRGGYKTQRELLREEGRAPFAAGGERGPPELYEVTVDIGRDGSFIFEDGRHRLAMAKFLGLESIPVRVLVRHAEWQRQRDSYFADSSDDAPPHPDLVSPGEA